ncbi:PAF acetylhydrolase [Massariosphaeria phaeospora]|uniref:1-alkyl-2-acetylglycerophosphocholine esterase n=1 Tax=Massariosphaeria phaeospora TaxID=100035 RepID=A0A7C8MNV1_9PLEO|nr:PAF acetylhydrolase [Massariosphaeria phaeospora]
MTYWSLVVCQFDLLKDAAFRAEAQPRLDYSSHRGPFSYSTTTLKEMHSRLSFLPLLLANTGAGYLLPNPPGKYNVTLTTGTLTDYNRDARTLMLSVFRPATCASTVPVFNMPNKTAEYQGPWIQKMFNVSLDLTPLFLEARLPVCPDDPSSCSPLHDVPVLLLSPGYRGSRLYYNVIASAIASEGFIVITMDHPGESNVITYPDGHTVYSNLSNVVDLDELAPYAYARAADISFTIDQLSNTTATSELLPQQFQSPTDRVAVLGHSLGGASAVLAASQDPRIHSALNIDGPFFGSLPPSGLSSPVLYVATERDDDPRFLAIWPELTGPKLWIKIANLAHEGMLDIPTMLQAAGQYTGELAELFGTTAPSEWVRIMTAYATEWMEGAFAGPLLQGREPDRFPEVSVVRKGNF